MCSGIYAAAATLFCNDDNLLNGILLYLLYLIQTNHNYIISVSRIIKSLEKVLIVPETLPGPADVVQHGLSALHPMPGRVPQQLLVLSLLQSSVDAIEVADSKVIRGLRVAVT